MPADSQLVVLLYKHDDIFEGGVCFLLIKANEKFLPISAVSSDKSVPWELLMTF
jgi:hypothetical protein